MHAYAYTGEMMVKVISLSEEAYTELKKLKNEDSFSEAILRIIKEKRKGTDYAAFARLAGAFKENKEEWDKIKTEIYEHRKKTRVRKWLF